MVSEVSAHNENRLRSTMQNDWFSSFTSLACEGLTSLQVENIVDEFAAMSSKIRRHVSVVNHDTIQIYGSNNNNYSYYFQ